MASGTIKKISLKYESLIPNFESNNDEWTAPSDGFVTLKANQTVSGLAYIYFIHGVTAMASIVCKNDTGGLTYTACTPVIKGNTYKLNMGGYTDVSVYFYSLH